MAKKMSELKTEELTAELKLTKDIEDYLDFDELASVSLAEYINALVENKKTKLSIGLDIDESNEFLKTAGVGILYPKLGRDSIIMFCLEKGWGIIECEELLEKYNESSIINEK